MEATTEGVEAAVATPRSAPIPVSTVRNVVWRNHRMKVDCYLYTTPSIMDDNANFLHYCTWIISGGNGECGRGSCGAHRSYRGARFKIGSCNQDSWCTLVDDTIEPLRQNLFSRRTFHM